MTKTEVLEQLETDITDPGSYKSGEYLRTHVLSRAKAISSMDRDGLVEAMREWLGMRSEPKTMIAVMVSEKLRLKELKSDIETLREDVFAGKYFPRFYLREIDATLKVLA